MRMENNIRDIQSTIERLKKADRPAGKLFDRFFSVSISESRMTLPEKMRLSLEGKFDIAGLEKQKIVRIDNKITGESTIFNSLRGKRPQQTSPSQEDLQKEEAFCHPQDQTPQDPIGRLEGKHTITAANLMSYNRHHSLVIFKKHDPLDIKYPAFSEALDAAFEWFEKTNTLDKKSVHPILIWNYLWKSAASIIHPHLQIMLSETQFPSQKNMEKISSSYRKKHNSDYLKDFSKIHDSLNLLTRNKDAQIISHLVPIKENEVIVIGKFNDSFKKSLYSVVKMYKKIGVESFNMALMLPRVGEIKNGTIVARFVDRGKLSTKTADFGAMEIYSGSHIVSSDPFALAEKIRRSI
jgi:hypothetical protein